MSANKSSPDDVAAFRTGGAEGNPDDTGASFSSSVHGSTLGASAVGPNAHATGIVNIHRHGLSFTETEKLFGLLFEQNFPRLAESARVEARRRVDEFAAAFTRVAVEHKITEAQIEGLADPEVQFVLNEAVQAAARKNSAELRGILARLIARRLQSTDDEPKEQLLNEAVSVVGKLTTSQLRTIVLCFLVRDTTWRLEPYTWQTFNELLKSKLSPFAVVNPSNIDLEQIERLGCGLHEQQLVTFIGIWMGRFRQLFNKAKVVPSSGGYEQDFRRESAIGAQFADLWNQLRLDSFRLTKLGIVVAASSCEQVLREGFPLGDWIR